MREPCVRRASGTSSRLSLLLMLGWSLQLEGLTISVPPQKPSKHAERLRNMLDAVCVSDGALALVEDPTERTLLRGVRAAAVEPDVVEAFTILYEDIAPIRVAGDLIFRPLQRRVSEANACEAQLAAEVEYSPKELAAARRLFDLVDADGSGTIDRDELLASGLLGPACSTEEQVDELLAEIDTDGDQQISFVEFILAATRLLYIDNSDGGCGIAVKLAQAEESVMEAVDRRARGSNCNHSIGDALNTEVKKKARTRATPDEKFDHMLVSVREWAHALEAARDAPDDIREAGRIERVLHGSIVGSRNEYVVEALRLCYTRYKPLRLMGDLIFSLMGRVMKNKS
mmetsp:Transcript_21963/g.66771  ORF Transcript_21963/g.66771 Transcript_21963/m.66771 type:complete len:343 (-) Transcript_21963:377-1405(-)|eukprot:scaffold228044_cov31-Tisochrysis_lutea.AAC.1